MSTPRTLLASVLLGLSTISAAQTAAADEGLARADLNAGVEPKATSAGAIATLPKPLPSFELPSFSDTDILGRPRSYFRIESFRARYTHYDQRGRGYQSRGGPPGGPGDERLTVEQGQLEVVARQGEHLTHRIWLPIDIVTAASPDAIDVVSRASATNEAGSFDWTVTYDKAPGQSLFLRTGLHEEENFRSWNVGAGGTYSFAEENTVVAGSYNQIFDWFDKYALNGAHDGHTARTSTNFNAGLTQLLSPTTMAHLNYGITLQQGQLSNGWNSVPLLEGGVALEILPNVRQRHAVVGRIAQFLPWNGVLKGFYRYYSDDWGVRAHTLETELYQRVASFAYLRLNYRFHTQTAVDFFTTATAPAFLRATSDSDLQNLNAHTFGVKGALDIPTPLVDKLHFDVEVERYFRSNDLGVNVYSCGLGFLF
ncbi:MAG: DUF3570 domain-containing protein [Minicystis sp.]